MDIVFEAQNVKKTFGGVKALKSGCLRVSSGSLHALMGENGAGKSTLGKIISGVFPADSGQMTLMGAPYAPGNPLEAQRAGVAMVFQELDLFPNLSIADNVAINNAALEKRGVVRRSALHRAVRPFLEMVGLTEEPGTKVAALSLGRQQLVAIARALSFDAQLIVFDEPTSSLTEEAVETLFGLIRRLRERGVAMIYVSHKMNEIFRIADSITVLRDGDTVGERAASETNSEELIRMMVGRAIDPTAADEHREPGPVLLSVRDLTTTRLQGVTFDLHRGEVLGLAGLVGAGRSELGAALFGLDRIRGGRIEIDGKPYAPKSPRAALAAGVGLVPEDRKGQGLAMHLPVRANATLTTIGEASHLGVIRSGREHARYLEAERRTALRAPSWALPVSSLSGGNQQKVLVGRWLLADPDVLFLDDPTRGVDVGAKEDVYRIIRETAADGKGVLFVSSELPELLRCCDRILVLHEGRMAGVLARSEATQEKILHLALHGAPSEDAA